MESLSEEAINTSGKGAKKSNKNSTRVQRNDLPPKIKLLKFVFFERKKIKRRSHPNVQNIPGP